MKALLVGILVACSGFAAWAQDDAQAQSSSDRTFGGLFVEPAVTYEISNSQIDWPAPFENSSGHLKGFGVAGKLGIHIKEAFFAAADVRYNRPTFEDSSNNLNATAEGWNYGVDVGMQTPVVGLRVWAGYVLGGQLNPEASNSVDFKFSDPKGYRIGAGFHIQSVSLNLEYQDLEYGKTTVEALGPFNINTSFSGSKYENKSWIASVSFPMEL